MQQAVLRITFGLGLVALVPSTASARINFGTSAFVGSWCAQGDTNRPERITAGGPLQIHFRNWMGATATGLLNGPKSNRVVVSKWNYISGTLGPAGQRINWSNDTYWTRCNAVVRH